eukprot:RCo043543
MSGKERVLSLEGFSDEGAVDDGRKGKRSTSFPASRFGIGKSDIHRAMTVPLRTAGHVTPTADLEPVQRTKSRVDVAVRSRQHDGVLTGEIKRSMSSRRS